MRRSKEFRLAMRHKAICHKKSLSISLSSNGTEWYSVDGKYDKNKIRCDCGICKPGRKFKYPSLRTERELEKLKLELADFYTA